MLPTNPRQQAMPIASPCTKVCTIDPRSKLCVGCGRSLAEIAQWGSISDAERSRIMAELPQRFASGLVHAPGGEITRA
jgi:predicted Fe-S protein YdhL (DUF1289 family)